MVWLGAVPPLEYEYLLPNEKTNSLSKSPTDTFRSPLSLNSLEFLSALIGGGLAWFWLRYNIWHAQPWYWGFDNLPTWPYPEWFINTREHLLTLTWPVAVAIAISTIFLVRSYRDNIRHFSSSGHLVLAWPLIDFLFLATIGSFGIFCLPIQFVLALVVAVRSSKKQQYLGDLMVIPLSIAWTILGYWYSLMWWELIGD